VGFILIAGNLVFGFLDIESGWPFACYPTFSDLATDRYPSIEYDILDAQGVEKHKTVYTLVSRHVGADRISGLMRAIVNIKDVERRKVKLSALWQELSQEDQELKKAQEVRFYLVDEYSDPAKQNLNPIRRQLVCKIKL